MGALLWRDPACRALRPICISLPPDPQSPRVAPDRAVPIFNRTDIVNPNLHTFIATVRRNLDHTAAELDRQAAELIGRQPETFTEEDYDRLRADSGIRSLFAQYEREEAHLEMLEREAAREEADTESLLAQAELDEDLQGGD